MNNENIEWTSRQNTDVVKVVIDHEASQAAGTLVISHVELKDGTIVGG